MIDFRKIILTIMIFCLLPTAHFKAYANDAISGWRLDKGICNGEMLLDTEIKHSGAASMKLVNRTPASSNVYIMASSIVAVEAGKTYEFGGYTKSKNTYKAIFGIEWKASKEVRPLGASYDWQPFNIEYTAEETLNARYQVIIEGTSDGYWVDDLYIREKGSDVNLLANGNFEADALLSGSNVESLYNKVMSSDSFSIEDMKVVQGGLGYIQVDKKTEDITIDGSQEEWNKVSSVYMPTNSGQYATFSVDSNKKDLSADVNFAYDTENLYILVDVFDDVFFSYAGGGGNYWDGDSVQMAIGSETEDFGTEINFAYDDKLEKCNIYSPSWTSDKLDRIEVAVKREDSHTVYEIKLPWELKFENGMPDDGVLFDFLVNDNDGYGRRYCIELAPGISKSKSNAGFPMLVCKNEEEDFYGWVMIEYSNGIVCGYTCYLVNDNNNGRSFEVKNKFDATSQTMQVPGNTCKKIYNEFSQIGDFQIIYEISCNGKTQIAKSHKFTSKYEYCSVETAKVVLEMAKIYATELKPLMDKCKEMGISTDYELINYSIIERWPQYIQEDIDNNDLTRMFYTRDALTRVYNEAKDALTAYINGEREPFAVPRYVTSPIRTDGVSTWATTSTGDALEERPVFFVGYGHFYMAENDEAVFQNFGANTIAMETGPDRIVDKRGLYPNSVEGHPEFSWAEHGINHLKSVLKVGEDNNISVNIMFGSLLFPSWLYETYPDLVTGSPEFIKYNVMDERAKEVIKLCLTKFVTELKDYKSLNSICISNEPQFFTNRMPEFFHPNWVAFLKERYHDDLDILNSAYHTEYTSFDEIQIPTDTMHTLTAADIKRGTGVKYNDYRDFNDSIFSEWHKFMVDIIKEIAPDMPVHSKMMPTIGTNDNVSYESGTGYDYYYNIFDWNGNDSSTYLNDKKFGYRNLNQTIWYDYMRSFKEAPIINTEDHIICDNDVTWTEEQADFATQAVWQGAIHGRAISDIWVWQRSYTEHSLKGGILFRPDAINKIGRANFDLNRLAYEITALQNEKPEVAVFFSDTARTFSPEYMSGVYALYEASVFAGKNTRFVTEDIINDVSLNDYKVLMIPKTVYIKASALKPIANFIKNGGKVLLADRETFSKSELDTDNDRKLVDYIIDNATLVIDKFSGTDARNGDGSKLVISPSYEELHKIVYDFLEGQNLNYITVVDAKTDEPVDYMEWESAIYNGKLLVNINNYGESRTIKLKVNDKIISKGIELRSGEQFEDGIVAEHLVSIVLETDVDNCFFDTFGHWAEENIKKLHSTGAVNGVDSSRFNPDKSVTRAEFLTMLLRICGMAPIEYMGRIKDVENTKWYANYVQAAVDGGIINEDTFRPDDNITRQEMCELLIACYAKHNGMSYDISNAVNKAIDLGFLVGYDDGSIGENNVLTRAEAATVLAKW